MGVQQLFYHGFHGLKTDVMDKTEKGKGGPLAPSTRRFKEHPEPPYSARAGAARSCLKT
jgi:hypothetical protein